MRKKKNRNWRLDHTSPSYKYILYYIKNNFVCLWVEKKNEIIKRKKRKKKKKKEKCGKKGKKEIIKKKKVKKKKTKHFDNENNKKIIIIKRKQKLCFFKKLLEPKGFEFRTTAKIETAWRNNEKFFFGKEHYRSDIIFYLLFIYVDMVNILKWTLARSKQCKRLNGYNATNNITFFIIYLI
ncbi:hypothetical protein RFI_26392 [Reticulomyxa filosa]|uniref:Uncharacterized protein n=1 Tax=Reticulomyxa filosa TaxID=46433 RepID=X6MAF7_RETFI|nr:hypothetical protein RFI_26392 [Reticulomyxa filosa]|eukprot:ETO10983.1 hypothetical protein RFI_26392 [Reticulomyxa filosa]